MYCSSCGKQIPNDSVYCPECGNATRGEAAVAAPKASYRGTGLGVSAPTAVPAEIKGWNWGGFLLTFIWGIGNGVYISLLVLLAFIPVLGFLIGLGMSIYLGLKGNELAWQKKRWQSIEHFKAVQRNWAIAGVVVLAVALFFSFVFAFMGDPYEYSY